MQPMAEKNNNHSDVLSSHLSFGEIPVYSSVKGKTDSHDNDGEDYGHCDGNSLPINPDVMPRASTKNAKGSKTMQTIAGVAGNILEWYGTYV